MGGGAELFRGAVRFVLQELFEAEATEAVGAGRYERSDTRVNDRNGHRLRLLATQTRRSTTWKCRDGAPCWSGRGKKLPLCS